MNKLNLLPKLAIAGAIGTVSTVGILTASAEASTLTPGSGITWTDATTDFRGQVDISDPNDTFNVTFMFDGVNNPPMPLATIFNPTGDFGNWFNNNQQIALPPVAVTFQQVMPAPGTPPALAVYSATDDFEFDFTSVLPSGATKADGTTLVTELKYVVPGLPRGDADGAAQFLVGDITATGVELDLCLTTCEDRPYWLVNGKRNSQIGDFQFEDTAALGGAFQVQSSVTGVPEPGTVLGLFVIGGLGLGLKGKKQS